ncbi:Carboxypeptidase regulatory-like domain-containing protein [Granulicella pectinivorans]|uniref:Carboxypeptidase regulatory-like domain-containing protein n=1 Tax=Granulicella pectinivorans TaxID=474950 RepID=A0A1I6L4B6_9BACT|nr:carboxypeptidase-like regulatory domain-containing protein [Granulicella pectinivorans]SFR98284.1 Carboxypeptidase regulatory-like domain-containing protein [Granulicella pectinivorans]
MTMQSRSKEFHPLDLLVRHTQNPVRRICAGLLAALTILCLVSATPLQAQTTQASVRGNVHDKDNAVIVGATLKLVNVETAVAATTVTNPNGDYLFVNINPGTYTLQASYQGFSPQKLKPFLLQVNQTSTLDFRLAAGTQEVVEVEAVGQGIQASSSELGLTLTSKQIEDIPLNSRNFTSLLTTAPGVSPVVVSGSQSASYTTSIGPVIIPSVNGQGNRSDIFVVDGILDIETFGNAYAVQPMIDAIQDQKLQSHNDSAEFGGSTGGTINVATKSGTNVFHGSAWEYNKSPSLQAVPYFSTSVPQQKQNQFGASFGGPVIIPHLYHGKDKTFFFAAYEGFRLNSPSTSYYFVPTPAQLAGDFTAAGLPKIYDPASTVCTPSGTCSRTQFSYQGILNKIAPGRLNQGDIAYAKYALPAYTSTPLPIGNAFQNSPSTQSLNSFDARIDETIGAKDSAYFRFMNIRGNQTGGPSLLPNSTITSGYSFVGSYAHVFGANRVLHVQAGRTYENRNSIQRFVGVPSNLSSLVGFQSGLDSGYVTVGNLVPGISADGYFGAQGESGTPQTTANSWSGKGDFTQVVGKHTIKTGVEFNGIGEAQDIQYANIQMRAQETNSLLGDTSGDAAASFVLGVPGAFTKRNVVESLSFGGVFSYYLQDQFQITPALTLNAGLRYDLAFIPKFGRPQDGNQSVGNYDFNNGTYIVYKVPGSCASLGTAPCIPTPDGSLPAHVVASTDGRVFQNQYNNLQPRLGAAYRIGPQTVVRGGIGLAFDNYAALVQNVRGVSGNWPSVAQIAQTGINNPTAANPFPGYTTQNLPALTALPSATPFNQFNWFVDPNTKDAYSLQYNLGVQRQLDKTTVVSASYVGSINRRLSVGGYYNVATTPGPGDPTARRPYSYIQPTYYTRSNGSGNYNSLQVQLTRSLFRGLAATVAYTWSKSIDEGCSGFFGTEGCNIQQIYNIRAERSVSAFNVPQNFVATYNYQLPIGRGKAVNINSRALDLLVGGWETSGFVRLHSGTPYTVNINTDIANIGNTGYERPNITGPTNAVNQSHKNWLNPNAFAIPAQYTYGTEGRNSLRTQFYNSFDMSILKEVPIYDRFHARFNIDAFNVFNHPIFGQPDSTLGDAQFGQIGATASGSRSIQLSGKLMF